MAEVTRGSLVQRMIGASMLNVATYEEVEADRTATGQAAAVVAIVAVAAAIGALGSGTDNIITAPLRQLLWWAVASGVVYLIGTRLFGGTADWGELLRTMGFAQAPGVLLVLGIIPVLGAIVGLAVGIWMLVTAIVAIRQALDVTTGKAVLTGLVAWIPLAILGWIFR